MLTPGRKVVGAPVRIAANFQDENRSDIDPTTVTLRIKSPCGTEYIYVYETDDELIRVNTGDYYVAFEPDMSGRWFYRWETTGTNMATAIQGNFLVQYSPFHDDLPLEYYR